MPLNYELDEAVDPNSVVDLADLRDRFEGPWVAANHVRTLFCTAAVAVLGWSLVLHGRSAAGRSARMTAGRRS